MSKVTLAAVNTALSAAGIDAELKRGNSYFYFAGPAVARASSTMVCVTSLSQRSLEEWVAEAKCIVEEANW